MSLAVTQAQLVLAAATVLVLAAVELSKSWRWRVLLPRGMGDFPRCLRALVAGQLANALAPIRGGDVLSVGLLRIEGGSLVAGAATLAGTKGLDAIGLAAIAVVVLGFALPNVSWTIAALVLVAVGLFVAWRAGWLARLLSTRIGGRLRLADLGASVAALRRPQILAVVLLASAIVWLAGGAANWLVLLSAGVPPTVDLAARVLVAGYIAGMLPAPPARIGVFEGAIVAALSSAGIGFNQALTVAVTLHICQLVEFGCLLAASLLLSRSSWRRTAPAQMRVS